MKRILFPTDFSETANNAFVYALELAKYQKAEFIVLHVYDSQNLVYEGCPPSIAEIYETIEWGKFENFKDQIPHLRKIAEEHGLEDVKMSHVLRHGNLVKIIKEIADAEKIDLIVMGTHGVSGLKEAFLGSNTGYVITNVPVMLLSVPLEAKFKKMRHFCFTTVFKDEDKKALWEVLDMAKRFHADVKCLTVKTSHFKETDEGMRKWKSDFDGEPVTFFIIENNDVKKTIRDFLVHQEIDVLSMLTHKRNLIEELFTHSFTQEFSYHCKTPILVLHEKSKLQM
ncbi:universal stress protein [Flavobacterium psychrotolerans]|uniref:Universal stress protein UspA n=1 Tax=Flavobacterium psychrotolerans TaxID=2169410 RepID=A0A2U1JM78_9FLAO|nr:universal stress protein [Flavobacterium psychrotolerans]PWA06252.1 universal stress protein UspA [Flavobacterium psychrotolerans]